LKVPSRRLFFGIALPPEGREALHRALANSQLPSSARPTPETNWHLTLVFLGNIAETHLPAVKRAAQRVNGQGFDLSLDRLGYWSRPRVVWAAPTAIPSELGHLIGDLQRQLKTAGIDTDSRPYAPHLTLARKVRPAPILADLEPLSWSVQRFQLYQSVSSPHGVRYPVLESWKLD
jgi:2'-5' RNA ligase